MTRWFLGLPVAPSDRPGMALRVSRYLQEFEIDTAEGSVRIPSHHVRFSIWYDDRAESAVSLPDDEAEALAHFLLASAQQEPEDQPESEAAEHSGPSLSES